jgi:hypothetical protein
VLPLTETLRTSPLHGRLPREQDEMPYAADLTLEYAGALTGLSLAWASAGSLRAAKLGGNHRNRAVVPRKPASNRLSKTNRVGSQHIL